MKYPPLSADTSPFAHQNTDQSTADPWLLWEAGEPLTALREAEMPGESTASAAPPDMLDTVPADPPMPQIRRPQYQAVLSRMRQAAMRTGTYAAWGG